jgi:Heterokaryon incompatibility protein (HET)
MVRLEHASEIPAKARYLALSHCWGTTPTLPTTRLLSDKYERARGGVPIYALPKTYRDAISVAKWFNAEYIWIDSLCIIQDSEEDWLKESVTMKDVYKNSLCTIAATAATNSSEGCFFRREIDFTRWTPMRIGWDSVAEGEYHCVYPNLWNDNVSEAPLNKRAWVLQERWLSPRVLHFARDQIYWECQELSACERYPSGVSAEILHLLEDQQLKRSTAPEVGTWMKIAEDYSHRLLTRNSDKLIAMSGIAMELCERTRQEYICGLWKPHIEAQLCWRVKAELANGIPVVRSKEYRAPSWSWLSIDGEISFPYKPNVGLNSDNDGDGGEKDFASLVKIESVSTQLPNDFTKTTSAVLTLRGFLQPVKWRGAHSLHQAGQVFIEGKMTKHIDLVFDDVTNNTSASGNSAPPGTVLLLPLILVAKDLTYGLIVTEPKNRAAAAAAATTTTDQRDHAHGAAVHTLARVGWFEARSSLSTLRRLRANLARQDRGRAGAAARHDSRSVIRLI